MDGMWSVSPWFYSFLQKKRMPSGPSGDSELLLDTKGPRLCWSCDVTECKWPKKFWHHKPIQVWPNNIAESLSCAKRRVLKRNLKARFSFHNGCQTVGGGNSMATRKYKLVAGCTDDRKQTRHVIIRLCVPEGLRYTLLSPLIALFARPHYSPIVAGRASTLAQVCRRIR